MTALRTIVIVGRDAPLWLAANALQRALGPSGLSIEVIELPAQMQAPDLYPTLPALEAFHTLLGIDEHDLLKATRGSFTLGQSFHNFNGPGSFFHPYGSHGIALNGTPFLQFLTKARARGLNVAYEDFSLTAAAARQGRFVVPDADTEAFARTDYGYHLPAAAYGAFLKERAIAAGISVHAARHVAVELNPEGGIAAVDIGGRRIPGDLFIDVTGAQSDLLRGALKTPFETWRSWFPCNRILTARAGRLSPLPPYAQIRQLDNGWLGLYATQGATHVSYVFDGNAERDDQAMQSAAIVSALRLGDAVVTALEPGRSTPWVGNCIAIGEAACVFDPIDSVGLHAVQIGLVHLLALFPLDATHMPERDEYNRLMAMAFARMRDFQLVHSLFAAPRNSVPWTRAGMAAMPEGLRARVDAFSAAGLVPLFDEDSFQTDSWNAVFLGHGLRPESFDPAVDLTDDQALMAQLKRILGTIRAQVEKAHRHDAYLEIFCSDG